MEPIFSILAGGASAAALVFLMKGWISERLKQSIGHEYAQKLESYKTELNSKIEGIRHENNISRLRTSLFFDHQRDAFAAILTKISETNSCWMENYDPDEGLFSPVPRSSFRDLKNLFYKHQLFLDDECLMAMSLVIREYEKSIPMYDPIAGLEPQGNSSYNLALIEYVQPRLASIFRSKIGVESNPEHLMDTAVLSAIELVNNHHFPDIGIPPKSQLRTKTYDNAGDKVSMGRKHFDELRLLLRRFDEFLEQDGGWIHESQLEVPPLSG